VVSLVQLNSLNSQLGRGIGSTFPGIGSTSGIALFPVLPTPHRTFLVLSIVFVHVYFPVLCQPVAKWELLLRQLHPERVVGERWRAWVLEVWLGWWGQKVGLFLVLDVLVFSLALIVVLGG
jgi:hypothetical protein